jgi:GMP synthase (glutamine-hydrolysing)
MGGPQSPDTTIEQCPHFNAKEEIELIKRAIDHGKAVLGVCLGAQLIGEALGANFDHSPHREIGIFELTLTEAGKRDPIVSTFPSKLLVGHWHGDMPGLTEDSEILAYSAGCPRQIVRFTPRVYGFQCHFEFTPEAVEGMVESCSEELEKYKSQPYVQGAAALKSADYSEMNDYLYKFLDYIEAGERAGTEVERCSV